MAWPPPPITDLVGRRFGRLVVISRAGRLAGRKWHWWVKCDCGSPLKTVSGNQLKRGRTRSCGCLVRENNNRRRHGHASRRNHSPEYRSWNAMKRRCYNPNNKDWRSYGGRGIKVCRRWRNSFEKFLADMGPKPSPEYSLDRIDSNGDYEPSNCRWATSQQQYANRRPMRPLGPPSKEHRLAISAAKTGKKAITNGVITKLVVPGPLPAGWHYGTARHV